MKLGIENQTPIRGQTKLLDALTIPKIDQNLIKKVQDAIDIKTKPPGSLGRIEKLAVQMAGSQNTADPKADPACLFICAGDHGLVQEGVSAWPSEVTTQMVLNFLSGGAAANVFAKTNGVEITVIDAGVIGDLPKHDALVSANIRKGTRNALKEDALTPKEVQQALEFGAEQAIRAGNSGTRVIALGEMGIGNTSSAALLTHAVTGVDLNSLTGPGAGLDANGVGRKSQILSKTAARKPGNLSPLEALASFGGLEIAVMTGAIIGAASANATVLIDGFISTSAAICAITARPELVDFCVFSHKSHEPGHINMLETIDAKPLLDLDLRLGEGTGALLTLPLLRSACNMLSDMATFESAGVSDKTE